jgi:glutamyl-tRNA reductase
MNLNADHIRDRFCVAGINYRKADTQIRGVFAVDADVQKLILEAAGRMNMKSVFVLSTCNRTEIYGYVQHPQELAELLTSFTQGTMAEFLNHGFFACGSQAMHHLFRVAAGLDSQIIGDYEIQGQLKQSVALARSMDMLGPIMDRTINFVFQASKKIRSTTALSTGTVSVAFAAIEWLQQHMETGGENVLVVGTGKFGRNVCKNLLQYLPKCRLTICNRTNATAVELAGELGAGVIRYEDLPTRADHFDMIVVSTSASEHILLKEFFTSSRKRLIVDLSVPVNVDPAVGTLDNTMLANVDDISAILDRTIERRKEEIPKAELIIATFESEFYQWLHTYKHAPAIRHIKQQLTGLGQQASSRCEMSHEAIPVQPDLNVLVQETVNNLVVSLRNRAEKGCQFIEAYHTFLNHPAVVAVHTP